MIWVLLGVLTLSVLAWSVVQYFHIKKIQKMVDHLIEENKTLRRENVRIAIEAQEKERREIGQDIHDELGSTLFTMKMNLGLIEKQGLFIFESNEALKELKYALENSIEYVRGISRIMSPAFLENFGLSRAMIQMVRRINSSCVAKVEFHEVGDAAQLAKEKQLHIFRIIQEVINNSLRYASPWRITITFYWKSDNLDVEIFDDGYNYRFSEKYKTAGLGLSNIKDRANLIGADFTNDGLSDGNLARIHLPISDPE